MIKVYYFSGSGHTRRIAEYFHDKLKCGIISVDKEKKAEDTICDTAIVIFPVYCQNIPRIMGEYIKSIEAKYFVICAAYGRISYGNVLHEASRLVSGTVIAGVCIPTGHSFYNNKYQFDEGDLEKICDRIKNPRSAEIPKCRKNIFSDFFPYLRSRIGVKIIRKDRCNSCNICTLNCPMGAITEGKIGKSCIRCLRCVHQCPKKALEFKNTRILDSYLKRYYNDGVKIKLYL